MKTPSYQEQRVDKTISSVNQSNLQFKHLTKWFSKYQWWNEKKLMKYFRILFNRKLMLPMTEILFTVVRKKKSWNSDDLCN